MRVNVHYTGKDYDEHGHGFYRMMTWPSGWQTELADYYCDRVGQPRGSWVYMLLVVRRPDGTRAGTVAWHDDPVDGVVSENGERRGWYHAAGGKYPMLRKAMQALGADVEATTAVA